MQLHIKRNKNGCLKLRKHVVMGISGAITMFANLFVTLTAMKDFAVHQIVVYVMLVGVAKTVTSLVWKVHTEADVPLFANVCMENAAQSMVIAPAPQDLPDSFARRFALPASMELVAVICAYVTVRIYVIQLQESALVLLDMPEISVT